MSLIFGLSLPRKIYLVSDSRLTSVDGTYEDDFGKWLDLNQRLGVVVANSAHQASWILKRLIEKTRTPEASKWDFSDLEKYLTGDLKKIATEYYAETGHYGNSVTMIFGGFDKTSRLSIDAGIMGDVMSAPLVARGNGTSMVQTVDKDVVEAFSKTLHDASASGRTIENGVHFEVDLPKPRVLGVTISASDKGAVVEFENIECYEGLTFNPQYKTERVKLPVHLLSDLEHREGRSDEEEQKSIYEDYRHLLLYIDDLLDEKGWDTVGGQMVPILITDNSMGIATGQHVRVKNGSQYFGGIGVDEKGKVHYYNRDGSMSPYRFVYDYIDKFDGNGNSDAKL